MPTVSSNDALIIEVTREEYFEIKKLEQPADLADYERILGTEDMRATSILAASFHNRDIYTRIKKDGHEHRSSTANAES